MTVTELAAACGFTPIHIADETAPIKGAYACDLLSWVIGRAEEGAALVTVMTNVNVIAVSVMAELPCVVLCESVTPDEVTLQKARDQGVSILSSSKPTYETCLAIGKVL
ncbi:MAG: hypothetical protein IKY33_00090 [Clostridia bacterium]|nr:hypothetical protein [Clostridia bacterium]